MKKWRTMFRLLTLTILSSVFIVFIWANVSVPSLSERYDTRPAEMDVYEADSLPGPAACLLLETKVRTLKGVMALTINQSSALIAILYNKEEVSSYKINNVLAAEGLHLKVRSFESYKGPKCPVPHQYIGYLQKIKSTFRLR